MTLGEMPLLEVGESADVLLQAGDFLGAGVLTVDGAFEISGWNRWMEAATGWSAAEVVGRTLLDVFPELADTRGEAAFRRALGGETVMMSHRFHEFLLPMPADPAFPGFERMQQSARIAPLLSGGQAVGAVALIQDVTERVAREAELRTALDRAEIASQAKSDFMAAMSHELRTPLGAIIGYSDLLVSEVVGPLSELQKQHMRRVKSGAWHLLGIIEEILTFSRVDAGREPVHPEPVDASAVVVDAVSLVEPQAHEKGIALHVLLGDAPAELVTDPGKLRQILVNLLGTAVKFTDAGEVELRVWAEPETVCFQVTDTGPGIPPEFLDRIFEPFTQVDSAHTRVQGGTGLGLPVSRRLARLLGGDLEVVSTLGQGSRFTATIPLVPPVPPEPAASPDEP
ncbi:MAG TPA: ATP-binding protein [Longimicrobiaceae bacterium]|nr:ATP-binding protein [Longimicrobiaceae bacterium]